MTLTGIAHKSSFGRNHIISIREDDWDASIYDDEDSGEGENHDGDLIAGVMDSGDDTSTPNTSYCYN